LELDRREEDAMNVHGHSIDASLLSNGEWVLDVGCFGFPFSRSLQNLGMKVLAVDPNPSLSPPVGIHFENVALVSDSSRVEAEYIIASDPEANALVSAIDILRSSAHKVIKVRCDTIENLMRKYGIDMFDVIKLDCEGSEIDILTGMSKPVARQISVEFHAHCGQSHAATRKAVDHLVSLGYRPVQHQLNPCFGVANYWDSLFVRSDLIDDRIALFPSRCKNHFEVVSYEVGWPSSIKRDILGSVVDPAHIIIEAHAPSTVVLRSRQDCSVEVFGGTKPGGIKNSAFFVTQDGRLLPHEDGTFRSLTLSRDEEFALETTARNNSFCWAYWCLFDASVEYMSVHY
jgi:FkbM family methyltransferase